MYIGVPVSGMPVIGISYDHKWTVPDGAWHKYNLSPISIMNHNNDRICNKKVPVIIQNLIVDLPQCLWSFSLWCIVGWGLRGLECVDLCSDGTDYNCVNINWFMIMIIIVLITPIICRWPMIDVLSFKLTWAICTSIDHWYNQVHMVFLPRLSFGKTCFSVQLKWALAKCSVKRQVPLMGFSSRQYYYIPNGSWLKPLALNSRSAPKGHIESTESRHIIDIGFMDQIH